MENYSRLIYTVKEAQKAMGNMDKQIDKIRSEAKEEGRKEGKIEAIKGTYDHYFYNFMMQGAEVVKIIKRDFEIDYTFITNDFKTFHFFKDRMEITYNDEIVYTLNKKKQSTATEGIIDFHKEFISGHGITGKQKFEMEFGKKIEREMANEITRLTNTFKRSIA